MDALIGTRKGLFALDGDALHLVEFAGVPVTAATHDRRDGTTYAALDHGHFGVKVHRSDDGGATFTELAPPAYPDRPADASDTDPVRGDEVPWATKMLWTLEPGHPDEPGVLWAGTIPGGLFRSADRGESWELVRPLWDDPTRAEWFGGGYDNPGIHSISVDPRSARDIVVGISCGGAWRTTDGGSTWNLAASGMRARYMPPDVADNPAIQDPHRLAACRDDPDVVWCQHHSGIFRSTDRGSSWTEITDAGPSTFGFAVAAHPADSDTAWFVPATSDEVRIPVDGHMVVTRTRDGGASFEVLDTGLPADRTYHLVYRHAFDVDEHGERLLLGSTTGGLWASDDQGDTFREITSGLPQVNCVAFT
jgi:hypothetical protein